MNIKLQHPITDEMRKSVLEDLPLLKEVKDAGLRAKAVEAWCLVLAPHKHFHAGVRNPGNGFP